MAPSGPPAPTLFDWGWDDRAPFAADLRPAVAAEALALEDATVYHLDLELITPTELRGRLEVRYVNDSHRPATELYFQLLPNLLGGSLTVTDAALDGRGARAVAERDGSLLRVPLGAALAPGAAVVAALDFDLTVPTVGTGNYGILAYRNGVLSLPHGYPLLAVREPGGWATDLPAGYGDLVYAEASFYLVRIDAPGDLAIAATGRVLAREEAGERQRLTVAAGPVRDFYLAAGEGWEPVELEAGEVTVRGWATPEQRPGMSEAVEYAVAALGVFEELLGPYAYRELEFVPITTSALGVEFPGVIALERGLVRPGRELTESTVVHEVAHQWIYGMVGNDQQGEPWLDESLTQYLTMRYYHERYGPDAYLAYREHIVGYWRGVGEARIPVGRSVAAYTPMEYTAIVYGLGPLVLERLGELMGQAAWDSFLRAYTARYRFGVADSEGFERLAEAACECDLAEFFREWIRPDPDEGAVPGGAGAAGPVGRARPQA